MKMIDIWLWTLHTMLFLAAFWGFYAPFTWLWGVVLVLAYIVRMRAEKQKERSAVWHLTWQINTVWLVLLLWLLSLIFILCIGYWMDAEGSGTKQLDALASSGMSPMEGFLQLWGIPGIKGMVIVALAGFGASSVWPLGRAVHGMLALRRDCTPYDPHSGAALGFGLAVLLMLGAFCLSLA